jgi:segregation and condensation protein B
VSQPTDPQTTDPGAGNGAPGSLHPLDALVDLTDATLAAPDVVVDLRPGDTAGAHLASAGPPYPAPAGPPDPAPAEGADPATGQGELDLEAMPSGARGAVEAVLMVVEEPVEELALASALGMTVARVAELLRALAAEYDQAGRGFELRRVAGGWRVFSRPEYAAAVERFVLDGQTARLTQAALETLAIVAYRQPVSRVRVGAVRGVNVDAVMRTLVTRGLVEDAGHDPETGAVLYRTSTYFLQRIGLGSLDELPALAPYLPEVDVLEELGVGGTA